MSKLSSDSREGGETLKNVETTQVEGLVLCPNDKIQIKVTKSFTYVREEMMFVSHISNQEKFYLQPK